MISTPYFTVVIPTYNRADLIVTTLKSILSQTYQNFEIIIVDNCSTDNTLEVIKPFLENKKVKLITNDKNYERSISRNIGFKAATGDFLTLLDSDDLMYPNNLKDAARFVASNPDIHVFHNLFELVNTNGEVIYKYRFPSISNAPKAITGGNFLSCIGVFISKEVYRSYFFDENKEILGSEDWELWIRVLAKYKLGRINKINNAILQHGSRSISGYALDNIIARTHYIASKLTTDKELNKVYRKYINRLISSGYMFAASMANSGKMFSVALKYSLKTIQYDISTIFDIKLLRIIQIAIFRLQNKKGI